MPAAQLRRERRAPAGAHPRELLLEAAHVVGAHEVAERTRAQVLVAQAQQRAPGAVGLQDAAVWPQQRHADEGVRERAVETLLAALQLGHVALRLLLLALDRLEPALAHGLVGFLQAQ